MTDEQLSALLRLKRHEQPPPGYFDRLLEDVHRRQRAELLRGPLWKIALERWQTFFSEHSLGPLSYGGVLAAVAVLCAGGMALFGPVSGPAGSRVEVAQAIVPPPTLVAAAGPVLQLPGTTVHLVAAQPPLEYQKPSLHAGGREVPRYVIDARPVSYEASSITF